MYLEVINIFRMCMCIANNCVCVFVYLGSTFADLAFYVTHVFDSKLMFYHPKFRSCAPSLPVNLSTAIQCISTKSREQRLITKEHIATHANLIL